MHVPDVNLLPSTGHLWEEDKRTERLASTLLLAAGWVLLSLLLFINILSTNALRALETRVAEARREAVAVEQQLAQREARLHDIVEILRRVNRLEAELEDLERQGPFFSQILENIRAALPPRVSISSIRAQESLVVVEGVAGSPSLVVEFVRALREQGVASNIVVDQIEHGNHDAPPSTVYFRILLEY